MEVDSMGTLVAVPIPRNSVRPLNDAEWRAIRRLSELKSRKQEISKSAQPDVNACFDSLMPFLFSPVAKQAEQASFNPLSDLLAALTDKPNGKPVAKAATRSSNPNDVFGDMLPGPLATVTFTRCCNG
jgi:hypothetical protein